MRNTNWISLFWGFFRCGRPRVWCSLPCRSAFGVMRLIQCEGFTWAHSLNVFVSIWSPLHIPDFTFYCADQELITERWEVGIEHLSKGCVNGSWADEIGVVGFLFFFFVGGIRPPCPIFLIFPFTPYILEFNFPWVFTACHCLHSELEIGIKLEKITTFFFFPLQLHSEVSTL